MVYKISFLLLVCLLVSSCDRNEEDDPWPVWILYVNVTDAFDNEPVPNCARLVWRFSGASAIDTCDCYNGETDHIKLWESFGDREEVSISYHVECDGYRPSGAMSSVFRKSEAVTAPGRDGDEDIDIKNVRLVQSY